MGASAVLHKETQLNVRLKCLKRETAATRNFYKFYNEKTQRIGRAPFESEPQSRSDESLNASLAGANPELGRP